MKSTDQDEFYMSLLVEIQQFFFFFSTVLYWAGKTFFFAVGWSFREAVRAYRAGLFALDT